MKKFIPTVLYVILFSCDREEIVTPLNHDKIILAVSKDARFVQLLDKIADYNYKYGKLSARGLSDLELSESMKEEMNALVDLYAHLDKDYNNFYESGLNVIRNRPEINGARRIQEFHNSKVGGPIEYSCGPNNLCLTNSYAETAYNNCITGCTYSEAACISQGGGLSFCGNVYKSCKQSCCSFCNPI